MLAHAPRQPGSWLTWDVRQKFHVASVFHRSDFDCDFVPLHTAEGVQPARRRHRLVYRLSIISDHWCYRMAADGRKHIASFNPRGCFPRVVFWTVSYLGAKDVNSGSPFSDNHYSCSFFLCDDRNSIGEPPSMVLIQPNQALQHNDHGCHGLCRRTLRASHGRG